MSLKTREGFSAEESFHLGMLDCSVAPETERYVTKKHLIAFQRAINPTAWEAVTEDKDIFYRYAHALGLPVPTLYGVYIRDRAGWTASGRQPISGPEWQRFFTEECPAVFVVKPSRGAYGYGVRVVRRVGEAFTLSTGETLAGDQLPAVVFTPQRYSSFVIQQMLTCHPEILRISGSDALQTVRVITACGRDGSIALLSAGIKLVLGDELIDNPGLSEAVHTSMSLENGVIRSAVTKNPSGAGYSYVTHHPKTGLPIAGAKIPHALETFELARKAAGLFRPIRSIGWDIGITAEGPVIVEGNQWWGPPNDREDAVEILRRLRQTIEADS